MRVKLEKDLDRVRQEALATIDKWAMERRALFVTTEKLEIYRMKYEEAEYYLEKGTPGFLIDAESGRTGASCTEIAHLWINKFNEMMKLLASSESERLDYRERVRAASTYTDVKTVVGELDAI